MFWSKNFGLASSPDLNPLYYYCLGAIEKHSDMSAQKSAYSVCAAIIDVYNNMDGSTPLTLPIAWNPALKQ